MVAIHQQEQFKARIMRWLAIGIMDTEAVFTNFANAFLEFFAAPSHVREGSLFIVPRQAAEPLT